MLTYFPAVYPDELLYSVPARYHRRTGARSDAQTVETRRWVVAQVDLPGALDRLAERIPPERALHVDRILDELTLLPYYVDCQAAREIAAYHVLSHADGRAAGVLFSAAAPCGSRTKWIAMAWFSPRGV